MRAAEEHLGEQWSAWSAAEVGAWARSLLAAHRFREETVHTAVAVLQQHDIIGSVLPLLTSEDLVSLGVPLGVSKLLVHSVGRLRSCAPPASAALEASDIALCKAPGLSFLLDNYMCDSQSSEESSGDGWVRTPKRPERGTFCPIRGTPCLP